MLDAAFDTETRLIIKGNMVPEMACLTTAERVGTEIRTQILSPNDGLDWVEAALENPDVNLIGHNLPFDACVTIGMRPRLLSKWFGKLEDGQAMDTMVRQQLLDAATGEMKFHLEEDGTPKRTAYSLAALAWRDLKKYLKKEDTWRLRYGELIGIPIPSWPDDASKYAIDDAITTLEVFEKQTELAGGSIPNSVEQHRASLALYLMSVWGLRTQGEAVATLKAELEKEYAAFMGKLRPTGLIKQTKKKGVIHDTKDMKAIKSRVEAAFVSRGEACPRTDESKKFPEGQVATDKKTLLATGDPDLKSLAEMGATAKLLQTYVPVLESGTVVPINPRYNVLVETGRTSCQNPNIQNLPRKHGVRECYVPRDGWVFVFSDLDTIELRALASVTLAVTGRSEMAEALRRGEDLHLSLAADMLGISYEEAIKRKNEGDAEVNDHRQQAKISNFGFPGGLGAETMQAYAEQFGFSFTFEKCQELRDAWFRRWPEMRDYFNYVTEIADSDRPVVQLRSGRVRGGASFCAIANGYFQGLTADGCKEALWRVAKECYITPSSPLYGCRPVLFIHDEIGMEVPYRAFGPQRASDAADRLTQVMIESMEKWIPDVPITSKPVMVRRWYKGAEAVRVGGLLVPSKPVVTERDGKKRTRWVADVEVEEERNAA